MNQLGPGCLAFLLVFVPKRVPKTPKYPARFARRNVEFPKDFKHFGENGVPKTPEIRRAWRAETLIFSRISNDFGEKGCPKTQEIRRASRAPAGAPDGRASPQIGVSTPKKDFPFINQLGRSPKIFLWENLNQEEFLSYKRFFIHQNTFLFHQPGPDPERKSLPKTFFAQTHCSVFTHSCLRKCPNFDPIPLKDKVL